jgi:MFS family permease
MKTNRLGSRIWTVLILFGLFGQLAWVIENMYFNLFLYNTISGDPSAIAWMVAASAATATITTIFMGALSDKIGKRKQFIAVGYVLWGLTTLSFAFISVDAVASVLPFADAVAATVAIVILMDCIMTFFGSMANDGAFNAWVTDQTNANNRGKVEGVLAVLPLIALLMIFGGFDGFVQNGQWDLFFLILGGMITLGGVVGLFLIKESNVQKSSTDYWQTLVFGFRPSSIKKNPPLYWYLLAMALFGIATQIYMPYFIIYIQRYLGIDAYALLLGVVLLSASLVSMIVGRYVTAQNKNRFFVPAMLVTFAGLLLLFVTRNPVAVGFAGFVMMAGNLVLTAVMSAKVRDYTPLDKAGHFQGIRMIFFVLIPMIVGPFIGSSVISSANEFYLDLGVIKPVPTPAIFLASAIALLFLAIPLWRVFRWEKQPKKEVIE